MILSLELLAVAALILLNGYFVAAEYALVTARRTRMQALADQGNRRARAVLKIVADPPRFIAAMQLGVTGTSLAIGALGEQALAEVFDPIFASVIAFALAFLIITFLHVVVGELVPKGVALGYSERTALAVSSPVRGFFVVFKPLIWVLQRSSSAILRALGLTPPGGEMEVYSEAELKMLLSRSREEGEIEEQEQEMLYKVFDFADKEVSAVMVPRPEVVALSIDLPPEEALAAVIESPYTRYPVYRDSIDQVVGILHVRDLFSALNDRGLEAVRLDQILRPAHIVPETKDLAALLGEFRRTNQHMAIVVDEYGELEGIVTLEDLLEEIVGEIEDEFDLPDESIERLEDGRVRIHGTFPVDDFNEQFGRALPVEDYHTIGGFVFGLLGRQPEPGDEAAHDGCRFKVLEVEGSRIERVEVELDEPQREPRLEEAS
ncbi:MAG TPA: hemolysin family protein [Gaiellaceae bacterium]|nr:hemolysin family protein [Gaiellaceae bacterium]